MRGGGYVVDALEAALWALRSTEGFESGVLAAVNLGDDADTTAAIYGQLAGAIHGLDGIPARWRERLHRYDEIVAFADALYDLDVARPAIARFEHIKPATIAECATPGDVAERSRDEGRFAVRGGGHDFAGPLVDDRGPDRHPRDARDPHRSRHRHGRRRRAARRDLRRARALRQDDRRGLRTDRRHHRADARRWHRHPRPPARVHVRPARRRPRRPVRRHDSSTPTRTSYGR